MKNKIEFYYEGEVINKFEYDSSFPIPEVGEQIDLWMPNPDFANLDYRWWVVTSRRLAYYSDQKNSSKTGFMVYLNVEPDPKDGYPKDDPNYNNYNEGPSKYSARPE